MLFIQFYPKTLTVIDFTDRLSITVSTPASYVELMSTISTAVFKTFGLVAGRQRCCGADAFAAQGPPLSCRWPQQPCGDVPRCDRICTGPSVGLESYTKSTHDREGVEDWLP